MTDRHDDATHTDTSQGSCCSSHASAAFSVVVIRDPVCGMTVDPAAGKPSATFGGHGDHFVRKAAGPNFRRSQKPF